MRLDFLIATSAVLLSGSAFSGAEDEAAGKGRGGGSAVGPAAPASFTDRPLAFVENRGQWDTPARFVARRGPMTARLEPTAIVLELRRRVSAETTEGLLLRLSFEGASEGVEVRGEELQRGKHNFFLGNDPEGWYSAVPGYSSVLYRGLYEGVDLRVRDHRGKLEYDLLLAPGADLRQVSIRAEGATELALEGDGSLRMETDRGPVDQSAPRTWYVLPSGEREEIECHFVALGGQRYGFELPEREPGLPVVIDPGLEWSTYLGGAGNDQLTAMDLDPIDGHVIVAGRTTSQNFPVTSGAFDVLYNGGLEHGAICCLDPDATGSDQLVWASYLGGIGMRDRIMDLHVADSGKIYLVGHTLANNFPTTSAVGTPYQTTHGGAWDTFVARMSSDGSTLEYSTYLGGTQGEWAVTMVHLGGDTVGVAGATPSTDFPCTLGCYQPNHAGGRDLFVSVLELAGNGPADLQYSTYLGGSDHEGSELFNGVPSNMAVTRLGLGIGGELVVAGLTHSGDFPVTSDAYSGALTGAPDAVVVRLAPAGGGLGDLLYSTYLGGSNEDGPFCLMVEPDDVIVMGGFSNSSDFPTTVGAFEPNYYDPLGRLDGILLWLDTTVPSDQQLLYSTFLAGDGQDGVGALVPDGSGGVIAAGWTGWDNITSNAFPVTCGAWQPEFKGYQDAVLIRLTPAGTGEGDLLYSTFLGGEFWDWPGDMVLDPSGSPSTVYVLGASWSADFPTTPGAYQESDAGLPDSFVLRMELDQGPWTYCSTAPNSVGPGALIGSLGTMSVTDNTFSLTVSGATPDQFGFFYYGQGQIELPFGDGFRCVSAAGAGVHRLSPAMLTDGTGSLQRLVDFTQPPAGSGPGRIDPGTAWNFQFWYRDPGGPGGSDFNLSDALRASFCP